jgi:L-lactate dehydrogenase (cytochrome)
MVNYNVNYPGIDDLIRKAKQRMPKFAFEYLDGGCNEDVNLYKNTKEIRDIELIPYYLREYKEPSLKTTLFGHEYDAPFGISPVGLQGLMWPNSAEILAKSAVEQNVPFILSTVTTASIEKVGEITGGKFWYQLYNPADDKVRDDIFLRLEDAGCKTLVVLTDVPTFGYRPRDIRNGLAMPPQMTFKNILQILSHPTWALSTLYYGQPAFKTMQKYMPKGLNMKQLGLYMNKTFSGRISQERLQEIRERWKGNLVMKGVATAEDVGQAVRFGLDGVIVSNHGGRQLDAGESSIHTLYPIVEEYKDKIKIMIDSGLRTGPDIARVLAAGAEFAFMGRTFMYSVGALGAAGGDHAINILKLQLKQVMDQVCCAKVEDLVDHLKR